MTESSKPDSQGAEVGAELQSIAKLLRRLTTVIALGVLALWLIAAAQWATLLNYFGSDSMLPAAGVLVGALVLFGIGRLAWRKI